MSGIDDPLGPTNSAVPATEPLLRVIDLRIAFPTSRGLVRAVDGVSFDVHNGRTLGIVGESGSGKSVLSRAVMGLHHRTDAVRSGQVLLDGVDVNALSAKATRRLRGEQMAMVFQDPMTSLNPVLTIGRQLTETMLEHRKLSRSNRQALAVELLRSVGLPSPETLLQRYPFELSGGMRQRVTIAIALACDPRLLIADEPTTALDVTIQAQMLALLASLKRDRNMAMILVTHDLGVAAGRADEIIVMYAGKIVERAPTVDLFANTRMPYTEALLASIPTLDDEPHTPLRNISGKPPALIDSPVGCRFAPRCAYARARCAEEEPPMRSDPGLAAGHEYACWYPINLTRRPEPTGPIAARDERGLGAIA